MRQLCRLLRLRFAGVRLRAPRWLASDVDSRTGSIGRGSGQITIGRGAWLETGVVLHAYDGSIRIGNNAFLGPHVVIYGHGGIVIGDSCLIAMHCRILSSNHTLAPFGTLICSRPDELRPTRLGHDVWLGAGVTVLGGVTIGDGCIVGANAIVTKDLPAGSIAYGTPAVVHGRREGAPRA